MAAKAVVAAAKSAVTKDTNVCGRDCFMAANFTVNNIKLTCKGNQVVIAGTF